MASLPNVSRAPAAPAAAAYANPALTAKVLSTHGLLSNCLLPFFQSNYATMRAFLMASPAMRMSRDDLARAFKLQLESRKTVTYDDLQHYERLSGHPLTSDQITHLWISYANLNDMELQAILERFPKCDTIQILHCPNITAACLNILPSNLRDFGLYSDTLHDEDLALLPRELKQLRIAGNEFTDAAILNIPRGLQVLDLYGEQFTSAAILKLPLVLELLYMPGITHLAEECIIQLVLARPSLSALYCNDEWFDKEALDEIRAKYA